jgi:hypothetical protein
MIFSTRAGQVAGSSGSDWKMAECSLSMGSSVAPPAAHRVQEQLAAHHQRFLVGQQQALAGAGRGQAGRQAGGADDGGHHGVDRSPATRCPAPAAPASTRVRSPSDSSRVASSRRPPESRHHGNGRPELQALLQHQVDLRSGAEREHLEAVRVAGDHVQRVDADRAGGAQDAMRCFIVRQRGQHHGQGQRRQQGVDAIEHAAVAGQQLAGILGPGAALDQRLDQVADHAHGGQEHARRHQHQASPDGQQGVEAGHLRRLHCRSPAIQASASTTTPPCRPTRLPSSFRG